MAQDIRKLIKSESGEQEQLREGHLSRFEQKIAAVLIVAGGIVMMVYNNAFAKAEDPQQLVETTPATEAVVEPEILLSAISPEFKKVEDYYLASVNLEIARLEITDDNKELIDAFMKQLSDLDAEYKSLNREITESGVSEEMVNAMIENLKLRVELMIKLKAKLKEMKNAAQQEAAIQTV